MAASGITALNAGNVTALGIGVIAALIVIGIVLTALVTAIIGRILVFVVMVVLAVVVWQQRSTIENRISQHKCNFSFFGVHLDPPDSLKKYCG